MLPTMTQILFIQWKGEREMFGFCLIWGKKRCVMTNNHLTKFPIMGCYNWILTSFAKTVNRKRRGLLNSLKVMDTIKLILTVEGCNTCNSSTKSSSTLVPRTHCPACFRCFPAPTHPIQINKLLTSSGESRREHVRPTNMFSFENA